MVYTTLRMRRLNKERAYKPVQYDWPFHAGHRFDLCREDSVPRLNPQPLELGSGVLEWLRSPKLFCSADPGYTWP